MANPGATTFRSTRIMHLKPSDQEPKVERDQITVLRPSNGNTSIDARGNESWGAEHVTG